MKRVLVVDSDPRVCQAIHKALSVMSHAVSFAFDAVAAVSEARKQNPDMIIVDLSLPAGSGLLVVERLRALPAFMRTPIIVIADRGARLETERIFEAGANAFLPKPLNRHLLLDYVGRLLPTEQPQGVWIDASQPMAK
ncbi:MAG TPA: response regulator [Alloacidobacterium sp.]|nr:response regulator [Alloacidobacterium sp.]